MLGLMRAFVAFAALITCISLPSTSHAQASKCRAPQPVCAFAERVYAVSAFEPIGSAVLIAPGLLVTNRHLIADNEDAELFLADKSRVRARVVPTSMDRDLVLLEVAGLEKPPPVIADASPDADLYVIGADVGRGAIRVYRPGRLLAPKVPEKPKSRLHHDAESFPGNSGGALVDARGRLVGIVASGGEGRHEALPATDLAQLRQLSGVEHAVASRARGVAYRKCTAALDRAMSSHGRINAKEADFLGDQCRATGNRQLMDIAGQTLGRKRMLDRAVTMFSDALAMDPKSPNTMIAMAVTLHMAQRYEDEIGHLKPLLKMMPRDAQVLRLAIQAGTWSGDMAFTRRAFDLLKQHHPQLAPPAQRFIDNPPPRPR